MKPLVVLAAALLTVSAHAARIFCMTEFPTTSVIAEQDGDRLRVQVLHHNGVAYMPLHTGVMTPNDLATLEQKAGRLKRLGDAYELSWPVEKCEFSGDGIVSCLGGDAVTINGVEVKPWALYTRQLRSASSVGVFENAEVGLMLDVAGQTESFSMVYERNECAIK